MVSGIALKPQLIYFKALLERYYSLLKEKKELRKRNNQAQTNICNYLRKHNIDLTSQGAESQVKNM